MTTFTDFASMTPAIARAYLEQFLEEMDSALVQFANATKVELSYAPDSLCPAWEAIEHQLAWREGYLPAHSGQPEPQFRPDGIEEPSKLPSWFHHPSGAGYARFSAETLWLIDGAARYLGETLIRNVGGSWQVGDSRKPGYLFQNQPVVTGIAREPVSPMQTCAVLVSKSLRDGPQPRPRTLTDVYQQWSEHQRDRPGGASAFTEGRGL
jgi:hypothetical protein